MRGVTGGWWWRPLVRMVTGGVWVVVTLGEGGDWWWVIVVTLGEGGDWWWVIVATPGEGGDWWWWRPLVREVAGGDPW